MKLIIYICGMPRANLSHVFTNNFPFNYHPKKRNQSYSFVSGISININSWYLIHSFNNDIAPKLLSLFVFLGYFLQSTSQRLHIVMLKVYDGTSRELKAILDSPVDTFIPTGAKKDRRNNVNNSEIWWQVAVLGLFIMIIRTDTSQGETNNFLTQLKLSSREYCIHFRTEGY